MAVNIFTYQPGGHLPFCGDACDGTWTALPQGQESICSITSGTPSNRVIDLMAPYCQQWFTAMGKEPAVYIYYKNVNRFPTTV